MEEGEFHSFVSKITAEGGKDGPEDVIGGLSRAVFWLTWRHLSHTKVSHLVQIKGLSVGNF